MKFCVLRSGSSGNCTYIEHCDTRVILDAGGMSKIGLDRLFDEIGADPLQIDGVLISHLHTDHINKSTFNFCRSYNLPLFIHEENRGSLENIFDEKCRREVEIKNFRFEDSFSIGEICFTPFELSHDAAGVCSGFVFRCALNEDAPATGYAADLGHAPPKVINALKNCSALLIEANHDLSLLWSNPNRPYTHKARVGGAKGHLSNEQAAQAILEIINVSITRPRVVVLCHLSKDHNSPSLALKQVKNILGDNGKAVSFTVAKRDRRTEFLTFEEQDVFVKD
ncbi:MAG: MBL fold metallo-hydrolase [Chitinispirillales bacterium]|jgi:phosphoribosyl 1,2-cyclic phosphodiesterase|nr:MBL fold metallo-hydrolase [Chitinispirillales bacterium]